MRMEILSIVSLFGELYGNKKEFKFIFIFKKCLID